MTMTKSCPHNDYPALCSKCSINRYEYEQRSPSTSQPASGAGSERDSNDKMYSKSSRQTKQHVHTCMFCGQSGTEISDEQHSTLIEQRERLVTTLKQSREFICIQTWPPNKPRTADTQRAREAEGLVARIDAVLTTIEQGGETRG